MILKFTPFERNSQRSVPVQAKVTGSSVVLYNSSHSLLAWPESVPAQAISLIIMSATGTGGGGDSGVEVIVVPLSVVVETLGVVVVVSGVVVEISGVEVVSLRDPSTSLGMTVVVVLVSGVEEVVSGVVVKLSLRDSSTSLPPVASVGMTADGGDEPPPPPPP